MSDAAAPAPAKAPAKKATKAKKPAKKPDHPTTAVMVNAAIKGLADRKGSSLAAIKKYIAANYKVDVARLAPFIRKYLKKAVEAGKLTQVKGTGAAGSFKLNKAVKEEKPKKKPAAKKAKKPKAAAKPKKAKTPKKKAAAKPKKAKTPKKPKAKTPKKPKAAKPKKAKTPKKAAKKPAAKKAAKK